MKKLIVSLSAILIFTATATAQDWGNLINKGKEAIATGSTGGGISQGDAASAIKEALNNGIKTGVEKVSAPDGYLANAAIKILLPKEAETVESALRGIGQGELVDKTIRQMNHSAEQAATRATPIFIDAIKGLTITDALNIVNNQQQDAATQFLKRTTTEQLVATFKPTIKTVLDETKTTAVWGEMMGVYNRIPFVSPVNTDLPDYVTRKAIDGLFFMIAKEEAKIRKDPAAQASELIKKVFGSVVKK